MNIGKRIKSIRITHKLTLEEFGQKVGLSPSAVRGIEKGLRGTKTGIGTSIIIRICKAFNVDPRWLLLGEETIFMPELPTKYENDKFLSLPVLSQIPSGFPFAALKEIDGYLSVPKNVVDDKKAFIFKVKDDSMEPELYEDDLIIVSPAKKAHIRRRDDLAIVRYDSDKVVIKSVREEKQKIVLNSRNPKYRPRLITGDRTFEVIGKVILKIQFDYM